MRRSPWIPIFVLLAIGLYFAPREGGRAIDFNLNLNPLPQLESSLKLPADVETLFKKSRPATIRVEQVGNDGSQSIGTGFFIDSKGTFLTAYHVIEDGGHVNVTTLSGMRFTANVVGFDVARDIAVLKANVRGTVPFLPVARNEPALRSPILAIGNSHEQFLQPRLGRVLQYDARAYKFDFPQGTVMTSAPLAPGDSGGPIINTAGEAVGVVSYIQLANSDLTPLANSDDVQTVASFAVPVTRDDEIFNAVLNGEKRDVPVMGVTESNHAELYDVEGAVIGNVTPSGPADRAGLRAERFLPRRDAGGELTRRFSADVIVAVNGERVRDFNDMAFKIRSQRIGDTVTLTVMREGKQIDVAVKLAARKALEN
ncbi:S1C family serine protease [Deinococcus yavapaiensis]|uniref:S1-C subfamily serine protease n=1 Tax=Deinococcus yavapaiensis KR-236 TaxID=694435 RepID=A0A318S9R6_9DEIO|nr:S1C family serine protease [Deinococcus yavapaiensis]PYE55961.1 S1-C subfamily serine protease [Deinococcus yavapaiensis KR-236]